MKNVNVMRLVIGALAMPALVACSNSSGGGNSGGSAINRQGQTLPPPTTTQQNSNNAKNPFARGEQTQNQQTQNPQTQNQTPANQGVPTTPVNTPPSATTTATVTDKTVPGKIEPRIFSSRDGVVGNYVNTAGDSIPVPVVVEVNSVGQALVTGVSPQVPVGPIGQNATSKQVPVGTAPLAGSDYPGSRTSSEIDALNYSVGPGWPKGYEPNPRPIFTGAADERGFPYTDAKDDSIMAELVAKAEAYGADSQQLAGTIKDLSFSISGQVATLEVDLSIDGDTIRASFGGLVQGRTAQLAARSLRSDRGSSINYQLQAQVACVDANQECRNAVITIDQIIEGKVCRRVYAVHREMLRGIGDGHFTIFDQDYINWKSAPTPAQRAFLRILSNTVYANRALFGQIKQVDVSRNTPVLGYIGIRAWAVAYGRSAFEISMSKGYGYNVGDTTKFSGWLTKGSAPAQITEELNISGTYRSPEVNEMYDERYAGPAGISQAVLRGNDGRGDLALQFNFYNSNRVSQVNFSGLQVQTLRREEIRALVP